MNQTDKGVFYDPRKKELRYQFWESQEKAYKTWVEDDYQIVDFRAGYRSGKSILGSRATIKQALKHPNQRYLVMAQSYAEGSKTTYRILFSQLPGYSNDDPEESPLVKKYDKQKKVLTLQNGSKIIFGTAEKWHKHKGDEFSGIWLDEYAFYPNKYKIMEMLLSRLTSDYGPRSILITTTTNGFNYYYDLVVNKIDKNGDDLPWSIKSVQANSLNNPFLSSSAREHLKNTHANNKAEGLYGEFTAASGRVYQDFNKTTHVVDKNNYDLKNIRFYAYDSGWNDKRVVLEFGVTSYDQYIILDEFYRSESYVSDAIDWLKNKPDGTIISETEPEHMARFRQDIGGNVIKANKNIDEGIESVRDRFKLDHEDKPGLLVHYGCKNTIKEILSYMNEDVGSNQAVDHSCDCIRYLVHTLATKNISGSSRKSSVKKSSHKDVSEDFDAPAVNDILESNSHPFDTR